MTVSSLDITGDRAAMGAAIYRATGVRKGETISRDFPDFVEQASIPIGRRHTFRGVGTRISREWPSDGVYTPLLSNYEPDEQRYGKDRHTSLLYGSTIELRSPSDFQINTWLRNPESQKFEHVINDTRYTLSVDTLGVTTLTLTVPVADIDARESTIIERLPVTPDEAGDLIWSFSITRLSSSQYRIQSP